jgi:Protein of unknown function (DUF3800)
MGRRVYIYADEAGDPYFTKRKTASRYFILTSVALGDECDADRILLYLRQEFAWEGVRIPDGYFHASSDSPKVRADVLSVIASKPVRIDSVVLERAKTYDRIQADPVRFYQIAWYLLLKYVAPRVTDPGDELLVVAATLGDGKKRKLFHAAVEDVTSQVAELAKVSVRCVSWPAASDPNLWIADYASWAIQRKWEMSDPAARDLLGTQIKSEFRAFGT